MRKVLFIVTLLLVISVLIALGLYYWASRQAGQSVSVAGVSTDVNEIMDLYFYYPRNFYTSVDLADTVGFVWPDNPIRAGIIPHDLTQGMMIAHMLDGLSRQDVQRIVLLGPNHSESGSSDFITTDADWETDFGLVETDDQAVSQLMEHQGFSQDSDIIEKEHSVSSIVPYLEYYLPDITVVPVIFKANIQPSLVQSATDWLTDITDDQTVVLAAVDFSHYLSLDQAALNDLQTQQWLDNLDYQTIEKLGRDFNDYLDSPAVIGVLLRWLEKQGYKKSDIISHANSAGQTGTDDVPTTSYFEVIYY